MSDLLIKGMEMPKDGTGMYCIVFSDGKACASYKPFEWHEVVTVTPHGRLIDADVLKKIVADSKHMDAEIYNGRTFYSDHLCVGADYDDVCAAIDETPTVIEAEDGE